MKRIYRFLHIFGIHYWTTWKEVKTAFSPFGAFQQERKCLVCGFKQRYGGIL